MEFLCSGSKSIVQLSGAEIISVVDPVDEFWVIVMNGIATWAYYVDYNLIQEYFISKIIFSSLHLWFFTIFYVTKIARVWAVSEEWKNLVDRCFSSTKIKLSEAKLTTSNKNFAKLVDYLHKIKIARKVHASQNRKIYEASSIDKNHLL